MYKKINEHLLMGEVIPRHEPFSNLSRYLELERLQRERTSRYLEERRLQHERLVKHLEERRLQHERLMSGLRVADILRQRWPDTSRLLRAAEIQSERLISNASRLLMEERILQSPPSIGFPNIIRGRLSTDSFPPLVPSRPYAPSPVSPTAASNEVDEEIIPAPSPELVPITDHKPVFIVHGHDHETRDDVSKFVSNWGLTATILDKQPNKGRTIIEKFEDCADEASFAIVLLTPDDVGASVKDTANLKPRARQNVILELGYFLKAVGRPKVCILYKKGVELPSDIHGILYVHMDDAGEWRQKVIKEMESVGLLIDGKKI